MLSRQLGGNAHKALERSLPVLLSGMTGTVSKQHPENKDRENKHSCACTLSLLVFPQLFLSLKRNQVNGT